MFSVMIELKTIFFMKLFVIFLLIFPLSIYSQDSSSLYLNFKDTSFLLDSSQISLKVLDDMDSRFSTSFENNYWRILYVKNPKAAVKNKGLTIKILIRDSLLKVRMSDSVFYLNLPNINDLKNYHIKDLQLNEIQQAKDFKVINYATNHFNLNFRNILLNSSANALDSSQNRLNPNQVEEVYFYKISDAYKLAKKTHETKDFKKLFTGKIDTNVLSFLKLDSVYSSLFSIIYNNKDQISVLKSPFELNEGNVVHSNKDACFFLNNANDFLILYYNKIAGFSYNISYFKAKIPIVGNINLSKDFYVIPNSFKIYELEYDVKNTRIFVNGSYKFLFGSKIHEVKGTFVGDLFKDNELEVSANTIMEILQVLKEKK